MKGKIKRTFLSVPTMSLIAVLCLGTVFFLFLTHDYNRYQEPIGKVIKTARISQKPVIDEHQNHDQDTIQQVVVKLMNGPSKGQEIKIENKFTQAKIYDQEYHPGDYLFLKVDTTKQQTEVYSIKGVKRDHYLVLVGAIFVWILLLIGRGKGFFSVVSLAVNAGILSLILSIFIRSKRLSLIPYFLVAVLLFSVCSLLLVAGFKRKTYAAILATISGTLLSFLIGWTVITLLNHQGLHYEEMEFLTRPPHDIFLSSLLIGCLGAVMDVAITISSAMAELAESNPLISPKELRDSGMSIGRDLMGTMSNVLLFSYISGSLPLLIIFLKNNMSYQYTFSFILSLEFARALVGSIGIVLTVPLAVYITLFLLKRQEVRR